MYLRELRAVYVNRTDVEFTPSDDAVSGPSNAARLLRTLSEAEPVEVFGVLCLNTRHRVLAWHVVSRGQVDGVGVRPREVFQAALLANSSAIVCAHNHPSGEAEPSPEDRAVTQRLAEAGKLLGVPLLDHIIIGGEGRFYSFKERGEL